jgi:hypothetical protein
LSTIADPARRRWRLVLVPVAAVSLAGLVACGTGTTTASSTGAPDDTAMAAFASCMAENGVTLPERGAPDGGAGAGSAGGAAAGSGGAGAGSAPGAAAGGAGGGAAGGAGAVDGGSPPTGTPPAAGERPAPPGVDATAWAAAQEACAQYAPTPPTS